jgi:hypothetical protein
MAPQHTTGSPSKTVKDSTLYCTTSYGTIKSGAALDTRIKTHIKPTSTPHFTCRQAQVVRSALSSHQVQPARKHAQVGHKPMLSNATPPRTGMTDWPQPAWLTAASPAHQPQTAIPQQQQPSTLLRAPAADGCYQAHMRTIIWTFRCFAS